MSNCAEDTIVAKMVILGDQGVGKTSLVLRYVDKEFNRFVTPTIGACYFSCSINVHDTKVKLQIWDTAGQERFRAMAPMFYRNANAAMLVFDITKRETFKNIQHWVQELRGHVDKSMVLCIVGSKLDLAKNREVTRDEATQYSNSVGGKYYECSSVKAMGIEQVFENTALELIKSFGIMLTTLNVYNDDGDNVGIESSSTATDIGSIVIFRGSKEIIPHGRAVRSNCC